jgi:hypothetical protein
MPARKKPSKPLAKTKKGVNAGSTRSPQPRPKLSKREDDLLSHMRNGYQLQTSLWWDNPILRHLKDNIEVRSTANRGTIETLQRQGLIAMAKEGSVLNPTVWRLTSKGK